MFVVKKVAVVVVAVLTLHVAAAQKVVAQVEATVNTRMLMAFDAADILKRAPVGIDRPGTLAQSEFLREVNALWGVVEVGPRVFLDTPEAISWLETVASYAGPAFAAVTSKPAGIQVRYWRAYQNPDGSHPVTTTDNDRLELAVPSRWVFLATHKGTTERQMVECFSLCRVHFQFDPLP